MIDDDGTLCWRLVLIVNSAGLWWGWWRGRGAPRRGTVALLWCALLAAAWLECGPGWGLVATAGSLLLAWLGTALGARSDRPH